MHSSIGTKNKRDLKQLILKRIKNLYNFISTTILGFLVGEHKNESMILFLFLFLTFNKLIKDIIYIGESSSISTFLMKTCDWVSIFFFLGSETDPLFTLLSFYFLGN